MMMHNIASLFLLITCASSAPSGCIESCTSYLKQHQTQISGNLQTASHLQGLDYSRPGTWSEHNEYNVDNGHGKVHEERGQYITGPKTVRYYKKNYSSSYSTRYPNSEIFPDFEYESNKHGVHLPTIQEVSDSQHTYNQMDNSESVGQYKYNKIKNQQHTQSSYTKSNVQNERLEDLGQYSGNSQVVQQSASNLNTQISRKPYDTNTQSGNWINSYKTDGGRGRVFEEDGQYVSGAQKVRYYKKNYTSSYSSSDGIPIPEVTKTGIQDIQQEIEKFHKEIGKGFNQMSTADVIGSNNFQQAEMLDAQQSRISQTQTFLDNLRNSAQSQSSAIHSSMPGVSHYKEHWSARSHTKETSIPQHSIDITHTNQQSDQYTNNQYDNRHNLYQGMQQRDNYLHQSKESGFTSGKKMLLQKLVTGPDIVDCDYNSHSNAQYQTKYKRSAKYDKQDEVQTHSNVNDDFTQQTGEFDDFTQQTGEFDDFTQQTGEFDDFTQTGEFGDVTQQTSGKPEFNQESQLYQSWIPYTANQQSEDITQQTTEYDDLTQQTSGKLEFGQQSQFYQSSKPHNTNQQLEDFTQKTGEHNDFIQQISGNLELGQESQQSNQSRHTANQQLEDSIQQPEDFTQKTGEHNDFIQQISGNLELGQESQQSNQSRHTANQQLEDSIQQPGEFDDLTQQTGKFDDLTQQTGKFDDLTQQTGKFDDLTQQTGKFDDLTQQTRKFEDLTQQTGKFDDLTQQTGKFDDLTQQTGFDDLTQQTGKFDDLTQQTGKFDDLTQQTGKFDDLTQQTGKFDDLTQQTSGKVEFGQQSQHQAGDLQSIIQQLENLIQKTKESDNLAQQNLTQQTSGKLEFGQQSQQSNQPWISHTADEEIEDFTQKTGELNDFTQQTSGNLELGEDSQLHQSQKPYTSNQELDALTEKTRKYDDFTQQNSGKVEFGQQSQQSYQAWDLQSTIQQLEDLIQKTKEFDNIAQQSFSDETQQSHQSWNLHNTIQQLEDLIQKTRKSDDFTQQTSGKLEFGQESQQFYQSEKPYSVNQQLGGFTQKTESDDITQQSPGKLMFGQESEQSFSTWKPSLSQQSEIFVQPGDNLPKPAEKPKPRSRYSRLGLVINPQLSNQNQKNINLTAGNIVYELPPEVNIEHDIGNDKNHNIRGDQGQGKDVSNTLKPQTESSIYDNVDPVNWLHKSNDATVGLQWHYTYHPSDRRQFVQQIDQKNKESLQQQSTQGQFSNLQQNFDQETQNKYIIENSQQESQNYASEQGIKSVRKPFRYTQQENKLVSNQQITENGNLQKHIETASPELKPRILEVYGGGQYDPAHSEDIYSGITINPSATLPPESNTDPWDIREIPITTTELTPPPPPVEPLDINDTTETPRRSSVWSRIGHKITTTFDKAKEKARNIFG
ncbi:Involucrin [Melipona quadrifasciata]|uniref:Involucrin n=1 Tax=Melipona quadrifasciata TaxID=166423 RepID=A0A0M8ZTE1_9HYME|nr:Involucrin [Melipona quadrifasciata]